MHPFLLLVYNKPETDSAVTTEGASGHIANLESNFYFGQSKIWVKPG